MNDEFDPVFYFLRALLVISLLSVVIFFGITKLFS